jgi:hypothetical protein
MSAKVRWLVLVYRVPSDPSSNRVAVWRELKRIGALYLQQCACVVPDREDVVTEIAAVRSQITALKGSSTLFASAPLPAQEEAALVDQFRQLVAKQYAEIVEECETKFAKEIQSETARQNFSFAEAEEIAEDLEKIRRWFARARQRDWFGAPGREAVRDWIARCEKMLERFETEAHRRATRGQAPEGAEFAPVPAPAKAVPARRKTARRAAK